VFLVSVRKTFLGVTECKTFCSLRWKVCGWIAAQLVSGLISSINAELLSCREVMRFDSCRSDTCPPNSSQTAQAVNKPKDSTSVFTRRREGGDQLEQNYRQQSPRRMLSSCIPPSPLFSSRNYFQKRRESLESFLTAQSSCPTDVRFNSSAVHGMGNTMLQFLTVSAHTTNTTLAGTEARREADSVKNKLNWPNL